MTRSHSEFSWDLKQELQSAPVKTLLHLFQTIWDSDGLRGQSQFWELGEPWTMVHGRSLYKSVRCPKSFGLCLLSLWRRCKSPLLGIWKPRAHRSTVICAYTSYFWYLEEEGRGRFGGLEALQVIWKAQQIPRTGNPPFHPSWCL